jgi:hypothetical protein
VCEAAIESLGDDADADAYLCLAVARRLSGDDKGAMAAEDASGVKEPSFGVRVGMLVAQGHMHAGDWAEVDPLYRAMLATADILKAGNAAERTVAVVSNNLASELLGVKDRDATQDALMSDAAQAAFTYWSRVGTWVNQARGEYLLSLVQCSLGDPKSGRYSAERGLQIIDQADGEERVDEAFLHIARATACRAQGDGEAQSESLATAAALGAAFEGEGLIAWFQKELAKAR